jgi:hypothetical protein
MGSPRSSKKLALPKLEKGEMPYTVVVAGKHYGIDLTDTGLDSDEAGTTNVMTQVLRIRTDQGFHAERDTVLHEIIHAIEYNGHIALEERQVHALAATMLQVLRENPTLVEYLTKPFPLDK